MLLQEIILHMASKLNGERTISAPYHLLRGKRSGQTIQDVKSYGLTAYFSLFPRLSKKTFDQTIYRMIESGLMSMDGQSIPDVTEQGRAVLEKMPSLKLRGWLYRGNERLFFQRISLAVQTLSHANARQMAFIPVERDEKVQIWVRNFLLGTSYRTAGYTNMFHGELLSAMQNPSISDLHRTIFSHRLSGFQVSGVTWKQLSDALEIEEVDLHIRFIECLHIMLDEIAENPAAYRLLSMLSEGIKSSTPLTDSAKRTADLYKQGFTFEQIQSLRQLKTSTIEDHFVEIAMNDPSFPIQVFFPEVDSFQLVRKISMLQTKKLKTLKAEFPEYSYFQLRLLLAVGGDSNSGSNRNT